LSRLIQYAKVVVPLAIAATLAFSSSTSAVARQTESANRADTATDLEGGKHLYRKYCGQCHALTAALAAGFGSGRGLGTQGGPGFDNLRVPFNLSFLAITEPFIGHEILFHKMTLAQVRKVSEYVAAVTKHHTVLAQPIDG
jgi:hypothetical protein